MEGISCLYRFNMQNRSCPKDNLVRAKPSAVVSPGFARRLLVGPRIQVRICSKKKRHDWEQMGCNCKNDADLLVFSVIFRARLVLETMSHGSETGFEVKISPSWWLSSDLVWGSWDPVQASLSNPEHKQGKCPQSPTVPRTILAARSACWQQKHSTAFLGWMLLYVAWKVKVKYPRTQRSWVQMECIFHIYCIDFVNGLAKTQITSIE